MKFKTKNFKELSGDHISTLATYSPPPPPPAPPPIFIEVSATVQKLIRTASAFCM